MDSLLSWKPSPFIPSERYTVQGQDASAYELYVAIALEKYKLEFTFQVSIEGGWGRSGGQVLDFIVKTPPKDTPLEVNEEYWHKDVLYEEYLIAQIKAALGPDYADTMSIWGEECDTQEKAEQAVRRLFIL